MGFSMNKPNMNISYGGESNKQQKSNLMKDNPVAKHASAMHMAGKKAVAKSPVNMEDPKKNAKIASVEQTPKGDTKGLKKKKTIKRKPKPKTSHHMYGELKNKKTGEIVKTFGTKPGSPAQKYKK